MKKLTSQYVSTLVLEAIKSGSIKLRGPAGAGTTQAAIENAEIDAAYLLKLFDDLAIRRQTES